MLGIAREVLAQAPVKPEGFDGFDPDDLEGSLARLVTFNRDSAKSHSGIYRDLMVRKRKTEVDDLLNDLAGPLTTYAGEIIKAIERGERTCEVANLELLAAYERAERLGRPLNAVVDAVPRAPARARRAAARRADRGQGPDRHRRPPARQRQSPRDARRTGHGRRSGRRDAARRRRGRLRGHLAAGVRGRRDPPGRARGDEPLRPPANRRRVQRRLGRPGRRRRLRGRPGHRHRRLDPDPGALLRDRRVQAEPRRAAAGRRRGARADLRSCRACSPATSGSRPQVFSALTGAAPGNREPYGAADRASSPVSSNAPRSSRTWRPRCATRSALWRTPAARSSRSTARAFDELEKTFSDILLFEAWQVHGERVDGRPRPLRPGDPAAAALRRRGERAGYAGPWPHGERLLPAAAEVYAGIDVLLSPAAPFVAPATTPPVDTPEGDREGCSTAIHNLTGAPALVLPCGWSTAACRSGCSCRPPLGTDMELLAAAAVRGVDAQRRGPHPRRAP